MPELKSQITTGNVLQIVAMVIMMALGWGTLTAQVSSASSAAAEASARIADHEVRLRALEVQVLQTLTRMDARLSAIEGAVTR